MIGRPSGRALLVGLVVAFVAIVVGVGLWVLGSPAEERRRRLDERRVEDLREIAAAVDAYWTRTGAQPESLEALAGWQGLQAPRTDPDTGEPYAYRPAGPNRYELCATFAREDPGPEPRRRYELGPSFWHHGAGRHCFDLEAERVER